MADLGNLYFDILLRDLTDAQAQKIKQKLINILKIPITADSSGLQIAVERAIKNADLTPIKKEIERLFASADTSKLVTNVQTALQKAKGKADVTADKQMLVDSIKQALLNEQFKINVVVDKATARQAVQQALAQIKTWNGKYTADDLRAEKANTEKAKQALKAAQAQLALARAHKAAASASGLHLRASTALGSAMGQNIRIAGDLKNSFASLFSLYAVQHFLKNVIEIGGELEKQKLAMDAILGDKGQSGQITQQINALAVKSPFGVLQLNSFAKQLTAYTIPYNELYDTMKRLADISAAVGVDMGRIVLAYGQIRAAKFLKGTELRQLTEANIPMVDMLAKKFTELEGRIVSAGDVMDMISKKQVTFEHVKDVLWEITSEGGMFYNMQENLSESVSAKWKNLGDAVDLMYGKIAASNSGVLKAVPEMLTELVSHFQTLSYMLTGVASVWLSHKLAVSAANKMYGEQVLSSAKAGKQAEAERTYNLKLAQSYRTLTAVEQNYLKNKNARIAYSAQEAARTGQMTKEQALLAIALKKLSREEALVIAHTLGISKAEVQAALSAKKWTVTLKKLKLEMKSVLSSIGGFLASPWLWVTAGIEVFANLIGKQQEFVRRQRELRENLSTTADEGFRNLNDKVESYKLNDPSQMKSSELRQAITEMTGTLKDYSAASGLVLKEVYEGQDGKPLKLAEQYRVLQAALNETLEGYRQLSQYGSGFNLFDAADTTNGAPSWMHGFAGYGINEAVQDYGEMVSESQKALAKALGSDYRAIFEAVKKMREADKELAEATKGMNLTQQIEYLAKNYGRFSGKISELMSKMWDLGGSRGGYNSLNDYGIAVDKAIQQMESKIEPFLTSMTQMWINYRKAADSSFNPLSMSGADEQEIRQLVSAWVNSFNNVPEEVRRQLRDKLLEENFGLTIDVEVNVKESQFSDWQQEIHDMFGKSLDNLLLDSSSMDEFMSNVSKAAKEVKEKIQTLQPSYDNLMAVPKMLQKAFTESQKEIVENMGTYQKLLSLFEAVAEFFHFDLADPAQKKKNGSSSTKDQFAENIKEQLNLLKSVYSEYKKYAELMSKDDALQKMAKSGIFANFKGVTPTTIGEYREQLNMLLSQLDDSTKERRELKVSIQKVLMDIDQQALKEAAQAALKEVENYLEQSKAEWAIYTKVYDATGDKKLAKDAMNTFAAAKSWNPETESWAARLADDLADAGIMIDNLSKQSAEWMKENFDWDMDEAQAKELFQNNEALLKLYQDIQKQLRDNGKAQVEAGVKAIESTMDTTQKVAALNRQIEELQAKKESDPANGFLYDAQIQEITNEIANLETELFALSPLYAQIFGDMTYKTYGAVKAARNLAGELISSFKVTSYKDGKPDIYTVTYDTGEKDENGNAITKELQLRATVVERLQTRFKELYKTQQEKNPFEQLIDDLKLLGKETDADGNKIDQGELWNKIASGAAACTETVGGVTGALSEMFDAMGAEGIGAVFSGITKGLQSVGTIASAFATGGVIGGAFAIASEGIGLFTSIFASHDKKLQKVIENSQREVKVLQGLYSQIDSILEYSLGENSDYYIEQRNLLTAQRTELTKQLEAEMAKKKTDQDAVVDYQNQLAELNQQIKDFAETTLDEVYSINLKDWASEIGDALYDAWKSGEDGVEAFRNKVGEMMGDVMNEILKIKILQPMMTKLETMLFGDDGLGGYFGSDFKLDEDELKKIGDYLMGISDQADAYYDAMDAIEEYMQKQWGVTLKDTESSSEGLSKGIQSVTEDTADLLASYINAIRADVSIKRQLVDTIANTHLPQLSATAAAQLTELRAIAASTSINAQAAEDIRDLIKRNIDPGKGFKIA